MRRMPRTYMVDEEEETPEAPGEEHTHTGTQIHKRVRTEAYFVPCEWDFAWMYVGIPYVLCQWRGVGGL